MCFYGPIVLDVKSTIFIYPLYVPDENSETGAVYKGFEEALSRSRKYIVIKEDYVIKMLSQEGKDFSKITKIPSIPIYTETAKSIGADKFIMGYILLDDEGVELFINVFITKLEESVLKERIQRLDSASLLKDLPDFITKLEGGEKKYSIDEILYLFALLFFGIFGLFLLLKPFLETRFPDSGIVKKINTFCLSRVPELLFIFILLLFVYSYIYALNANMDYVQKFIASKGNLHMAGNTTEERIHAVFRYVPLLALCGFLFIYIRLKPEFQGMIRGKKRDFRVDWALPLTLLSAFCISLSMPSFLDINGWSFLGFIALVPLFQVFEKNSIGSGIFYGTVFGTFTTVITSYWLGTFSLVSLQIVMIIFLFSYVIFMVPALFIYKHAGPFRFLVFPAAWVAFEYLQSIGFAGYPWCLIGVSQYPNLPLIQISALTGVWGVTFLVVLANAAISQGIIFYIQKEYKKIIVPLSVCAGIYAIVLIGGCLYIQAKEKTAATPGRETVRIAQIQDSMDSRKHNTTEVIEVLMDLSDRVLGQKPDLIVWPEGSFDMDYIAFSQAILVRELREYQEKTGTWLLTGGMEYKNKEEVMKNPRGKNFPAYNSSMLLDPRGNMTASYYKIHLVPFTEYFPYEKELPGVYTMLKEFDINWWEKGEARVIFQHPQFTFFTPICYEDVFPGEIALFVKEGGDFILNLSNDFWSLSPVEGKQHAVTALFRSVENNRPLLRTTTSGLTCYIDTVGRIQSSLPHYETGSLVVDVPLPDKTLTFYTQFGDWFPWAMVICLCILGITGFLIKKKEGNR